MNTEIKISKTIPRQESISLQDWEAHIQKELVKTQEKNIKTELRNIRYGGNYIIRMELR